MVQKKSGTKKGSKSHKRIAFNLSNFIQKLRAQDVIELGCIFAFGLIILMISFLGKTNEPRTLILKEYAKERIVAEFPFSYTSDIATEEKAKLIRAKTPPIFDKTQETYKNFSFFIESLIKAYEAFASETLTVENSQKPEFTQYLNDKDELNRQEDFRAFNYQLVEDIFANTSTKERSKLFKECFKTLSELYAAGIYDQTINGDLNNQNTLFSISDITESNDSTSSPIVYEEALLSLKKAINDKAKDEDIANTLIAIFEFGLRPNLVFSESKTKISIEQAVYAMEPEVFSFEQGDTLIAPGQQISPLEIEKIKAYELAEDTLKGDSLFLNELFIKRSFLTLILLLMQVN